VVSSQVTLRQGEHKGWDAWHLQSGALELVLVPQVGGRIVGMLWRGHNLSFTQPEREGHIEDLLRIQDLHARKREMGFPLWGGDKTWLAPQTQWTEGVPFLDLDSGSYDLRVEQEGPEVVVVRMTSPTCRETGVQISRTVTMSSTAKGWTVTHRLFNAASTKVQWGAWDVNMVLKPGHVFLPRQVASRYPQGVKTFTEEGESVHVRDTVVSELGSLAVIRCSDPKAFKFGVDATEGWMLGVLDVAGLGLVGYRKQVHAFREMTYGHGCIAEVYNSDRYPYFEMEIHGPVVSLAPGEAFELNERQALFDLARRPQSEDEVRRHLEVGS
jgi:hypothetical protein